MNLFVAWSVTFLSFWQISSDIGVALEDGSLSDTLSSMALLVTGMDWSGLLFLLHVLCLSVLSVLLLALEDASIVSYLDALSLGGPSLFGHCGSMWSTDSLK